MSFALYATLIWFCSPMAFVFERPVMIRFSISEKATFDGAAAAVDGAAEKADDVVRDAAVGFKAAIAAGSFKVESRLVVR